MDYQTHMDLLKIVFAMSCLYGVRRLVLEVCLLGSLGEFGYRHVVDYCLDTDMAGSGNSYQAGQNLHGDRVGLAVLLEDRCSRLCQRRPNQQRVKARLIEQSDRVSITTP